MDLNAVYDFLVNNVPTIFGAASSCFVFGLTIYKKVVKPMREAYQNHMVHMGQLDEIYKEVKPDQGYSLKDQVGQVQRQITQIQGSVNKIDRRQKALLTYEEKGAFETDSQGHCIWVNRAYLKMLNATMDEVLGFGWKNYVHPLDREKVFEEWSFAVKEKRDFKMTFRYYTSGDEIICCTCEAFAIKDDSGDLAQFVGFVAQHIGLDKCP